MPYLDKEEKFYDYHTGEIEDNNIFDTRKASNSDAQQILDGSEYWRDEKNTYSEIVQMTPREYFELCAKDCFDKPVENIIQSRRLDKNILDHLSQVIRKYNRKFPIPYIDYAQEGHAEQEGLHRMMVAGDLYGWDTKFPVQIIKYVDEERAKKEHEWKHIRRVERYLERAIDRALRYNYYSIDELKDQLRDEFEQEVRYVDEFENNDFKLELLPLENKVMEVVVNDKYRCEFDADEINFIEPKDDSDADLEDIELDDLSDWMKDLLLDLKKNESLNEEYGLLEEYLVSPELLELIENKFGPRYFEQPICKEVCEYVHELCPKTEILKFAVAVWKIDHYSFDLISNKGHCVIKYKNKIYDYTSHQYDDYDLEYSAAQPRVLEYDEIRSKHYEMPIYVDKDYAISAY